LTIDDCYTQLFLLGSIKQHAFHYVWLRGLKRPMPG